MNRLFARTLRNQLGLALALAACLTFLLPPAPAQALFGSMTVKDEMEMGKQFDNAIRAQMGFVDDPEIVAYVKGVVDRVAKALPPQPWQIKSAVVANGSMNAFAIPGGYIYIFTGLILGVENEDELAAVIGHELGHVTERHVAKRMDQMKFLNVASVAGMVAGALLGSGGGSNSANLGKAVMMGSAAGAQSAFLMYTRDNEREADNVGINYLVKSGYNPDAMPRTFELMQKNRWFMSGDSVPSYLTTHPGLDERIGYLRERIKMMPQSYMQRVFQREQFRRIQTIIRARMTSADTALAYYENKPESDIICLDRVGKGIALERLKKFPLAEKSFQQALECGQDDALVLREAGMFYFNRGDFAKSAPLLQKATFLNPRDAMTQFFLARILGEKKDFAQAIPAMRRVSREVPEDSEVRYHLGRLLGESGDIFGAHLQLAYSALYGRDHEKAKFHLDRARHAARTEDEKKELSDLERAMGERRAAPPQARR